MIRSLWFFCTFGWKNDKRYILYNITYQLVNSLIPIAAVTVPRLIIDELMGDGRLDRITVYIGILAGYTMVASCLSVFFIKDGFTRRCRISTAFDQMLHRNLAYADCENLENPVFLDLKEKAEKFLYCDWHGFSYLFDCALMIIGKSITLLGIAAIITTLNPYMIILFAILAAVSAWVDGWAVKHAHKLSLDIVRDQRGWEYYSGLFYAAYSKETRINTLGEWLLNREAVYMNKAVNSIKKQNDFFIKSGSISALVTFVQQCAAYVYLTRQVLGAQISIGGFTMYAGAVTAFSSSLRTVMESVVEIRNYSVYFDALDEYLHVPQRLRQSGTFPVSPGRHTVEL